MTAAQIANAMSLLLQAARVIWRTGRNNELADNCYKAADNMSAELAKIEISVNGDVPVAGAVMPGKGPPALGIPEPLADTHDYIDRGDPMEKAAPEPTEELHACGRMWKGPGT